jgi:hypothetical protein
MQNWHRSGRRTSTGIRRTGACIFIRAASTSKILFRMTAYLFASLQVERVCMQATHIGLNNSVSSATTVEKRFLSISMCVYPYLALWSSACMGVVAFLDRTMFHQHARSRIACYTVIRLQLHAAVAYGLCSVSCTKTRSNRPLFGCICDAHSACTRKCGPKAAQIRVCSAQPRTMLRLDCALRIRFWQLKEPRIRGCR